jgi:hypothetical protein
MACRQGDWLFNIAAHFIVHIYGRDDVSELRSPKGLLFIPQVIYEHGEHDGIIVTGQN